ncbi:hypothetical protein F750_5202 [Streptomyces sp. PAMC 26508]|nr:hypothetical protein F750_5202 [Streptomyces sp. PAMC 26508]
MTVRPGAGRAEVARASPSRAPARKEMPCRTGPRHVPAGARCRRTQRMRQQWGP